MLKKIQTTGHEQVASKSASKEMRLSVINNSTFCEDQIAVFWPKKAKVMSYKMRGMDDKRCEHVVVDKQHHFVFVEGCTVPTLKLIHSYPDMYPKFTADPGALKFILKGANVMAPGLTNQNAHMDDVQEGSVVSLYVKDIQHAVGVGITTMSTSQIKKVNQGIAVDLVHYIGDGFWNFLYVGK